MPRSGATGQRFPTARCCRATRASGRRPPDRARRQPISSSRGRASTACAGWCICWHRVARADGIARARRCGAANIEPTGGNAMNRRIPFALAAAALIGSVQAQTKWDMPTPYSDGEFHTRNVRAFVEDVKKATDGALDITVHSNGSLIKHPDILRAVSTGQVNIAEFLLSQFGNEDPVFEADNIPFVAAGYDDAWKFYQEIGR